MGSVRRIETAPAATTSPLSERYAEAVAQSAEPAGRKTSVSPSAAAVPETAMRVSTPAKIGLGESEMSGGEGGGEGGGEDGGGVGGGDGGGGEGGGDGGGGDGGGEGGGGDGGGDGGGADGAWQKHCLACAARAIAAGQELSRERRRGGGSASIGGPCRAGAERSGGSIKPTLDRLTRAPAAENPTPSRLGALAPGLVRR